MGHLKKIILAATAALALTGLLGMSPASATTLEVGGVTQNQSITFTMSLKPGTSSITKDTFGLFVNTCTSSHVHWKTEIFSIVPTGAVSELTLSNCDHTVTVHKPGKLYIEWTSGTNGRLYSEEADITEYSTLHGTHITCTTGAGTLLGTITGAASGNATLDLNATLTCGPHAHSIKWTATYLITSPTGLGVSS